MTSTRTMQMPHGMAERSFSVCASVLHDAMNESSPIETVAPVVTRCIIAAKSAEWRLPPKMLKKTCCCALKPVTLK